MVIVACDGSPNKSSWLGLIVRLISFSVIWWWMVLWGGRESESAISREFSRCDHLAGKTSPPNKAASAQFCDIWLQDNAIKRWQLTLARRRRCSSWMWTHSSDFGGRLRTLEWIQGAPGRWFYRTPQCNSPDQAHRSESVVVHVWWGCVPARSFYFDRTEMIFVWELNAIRSFLRIAALHPHKNWSFVLMFLFKRLILKSTCVGSFCSGAWTQSSSLKCSDRLDLQNLEKISSDESLDVGKFQWTHRCRVMIGTCSPSLCCCWCPNGGDSMPRDPTGDCRLLR